MRTCRRIAAIRRQVKWLTALAEKRTALAESRLPSFQPLSEAETEAIVGAELLAALAAGAAVIRS